MKADELRTMSDEQLGLTLDELKEEWRHLRFEDAVGRLTNTARIGQIKRDIARVKTIQTERQINARIAALTAAESAE